MTGNEKPAWQTSFLRELWPVIVDRLRGWSLEWNTELFWLEVALACEFLQYARGVEAELNGEPQPPEFTWPVVLDPLDRSTVSNLLQQVSPGTAEAVRDVLKAASGSAASSEVAKPEAVHPEPAEAVHPEPAEAVHPEPAEAVHPEPAEAVESTPASANGKEPPTPEPETSHRALADGSIKDKLVYVLIRTNASSKGRGMTSAMIHSWAQQNRPEWKLSEKQIDGNLRHAAKGPDARLESENGVYWLKAGAVGPGKR